MNKILSFILLSFLPLSSFSQNKPNTLLWEISKTGNAKKSYLFGTFHEVNPRFFDSLKIVNSYLKKSNLLLVEAYEPENSNPEQAAVLQAKANKQINSWTKLKWDSILTSQQREKFKSYTQSEYGYEEMYTISPQILSYILIRNYLQGICDTVNRESYELMDSRIISVGLANKLKIIGFEKDQLNEIKIASEKDTLFGNNHSANRALDLMGYILNRDTTTVIAKLLSDYKKFDIDYQLNASTKESNYFLEGRNNNWLTVIPSYLANNSCFIAVGYRHLTQSYGLVAKLRKLGYSVVPIKI